MVLWFVGMSVVVVWAAFRSPALDYRLVVAGALLPLADAVTGGAWVLHTLAASVAVLLVVMVATRSRRLARRRWLGVPIGMFVHLVLDGTWTGAAPFWWPLGGGSDGFDGAVPELSRPVLGAVLELAGIAALAWCWRRFRLADPAHRHLLLTTGHLPRRL